MWAYTYKCELYIINVTPLYTFIYVKSTFINVNSTFINVTSTFINVTSTFINVNSTFINVGSHIYMKAHVYKCRPTYTYNGFNTILAQMAPYTQQSGHQQSNFPL